jgi:hypothetical protein
MRIRRLGLLGALAVTLIFAACDLNPQPLPPLDPENQATSGTDAGGGFGGRTVDAGGNSDESPDADLADAGAPPPTPDGGVDDAGDAGEGDAGDADTN